MVVHDFSSDEYRTIIINQHNTAHLDNNKTRINPLVKYRLRRGRSQQGVRKISLIKPTVCVQQPDQNGRLLAKTTSRNPGDE